MVFKPEQFTEQAQEVLARAQEIMRRYQQSQWDIEHILMALLEQNQGVPADILRELDVSLEAMHDRLHQLLDQAPKVAAESTQIYVTPRAARLLDRAKDEADRLNDEFIGTEHLLVALTQEDQGDVAKMLKEFSVDLEKVLPGPAKDTRRPQGDRRPRRESLSLPGALQHRPDPASPGR